MSGAKWSALETYTQVTLYGLGRLYLRIYMYMHTHTHAIAINEKKSP